MHKTCLNPLCLSAIFDPQYNIILKLSSTVQSTAGLEGSLLVGYSLKYFSEHNSITQLVMLLPPNA